MTREDKILLWIINIFTIIFVAFGAFVIFAGCCEKEIIKNDVKKDTTIVKIENKSFNFNDSLKIKYVSDSNITTHPFIAYLQKIDSLKKDTVFLQYQYPENKISIKYMTKNDTTFKETIREIQTKEVPKEKELTIWDSLKTASLFFSSIVLLFGLFGLYKYFNK